MRVSPNELSFASVESWKAIYGHRSGGAPTPIKSEFYDIYGAGFKSLCIGSERDPHKHGQMRSMLSAAFSTKSLRDQEYLISSAVDEFIMRLGEADFQAQGLNMTKWYEMIAFDSVGEMAFGQSFGSIKAGQFSTLLPLGRGGKARTTKGANHRGDLGTPHSWSELIVEHLYFITLADNLRRLPLVVTLWRLIFPSTLAHQNQNSRYSRKKVEE